MPYDAEIVFDLIERIYDCSMDPKLWPGTLAEICEAMQGVCAEVHSYNAQTVQLRNSYFHGWSDELMALAGQYSRFNPGTPIALVAPLGEPLWVERDYGFEAFSASLYYRLCLAGAGHRDYIHVPLVRNVAEVTGWGVTRHVTRGPFAEDDVVLARRLSPHIRRSLAIADLIADRKAADPTLQGLMDVLACAALVVERDGRILYRNTSGATELDRGILLQERKGRVTSPMSPVARLIADMAEPGAARGRDIEVDDPPTGLRQVTWVRLPGQGEDGGPYLLVVRTPAAELKTPLGTAAHMYRLTHAEIQVLAALLDGRSLDEAAELLGVSRSTVKTQLDSIFAKSGVRRQADLVRRVMGLTSFLGSASAPG